MKKYEFDVTLKNNSIMTITIVGDSENSAKEKIKSLPWVVDDAIVGIDLVSVGGNDL